MDRKSHQSYPTAEHDPQGRSATLTTFSVGLRNRLWTKRALLMFGALLVTFGALEIGFRAVALVRTAHALKAAERGETWAVYDEDLGYRLRPTDADPLGLHTPPIGAKVGGRPRVLILGDSIPHAGDSADDTLVAYTQRALQRNGLDCEFVNAGIPGYTTYQEMLFLKKFAPVLEPDLIGVCFCVNDLHEVLQVFQVRDGRIIGDQFDTAEQAAAEVHGRLYMLARKSMFLRWVRDRARDVAKRLSLQMGDGFVFDQRTDLATAWQDAPWETFEHWLDEIASTGRSRGARTFVVAFPFGAQYREDYLARDREYVLLPQRRLHDVCQRLQLPLLDLYDTIDPEVHLLSDAIHLTRAGRQEVGAVLARFLQYSELLAASPVSDSGTDRRGRDAS